MDEPVSEGGVRGRKISRGFRCTTRKSGVIRRSSHAVVSGAAVGSGLLIVEARGE